MRLPTRPLLDRLPVVLLPLLVLAASGVVPGVAPGATLVVRPDGGGDFPTIQAAIQAAQHGDTVLLADGVFRGDGNRDVDVGGKAITIASQSGDAASCIIDAQGTSEDTHRCFFFVSGEGPLATLRDVTLTGALVNGC